MATEKADAPYLDVRGLVKFFGADRAVDNISFSVPRGRFLTLLGPSGCGKTTTLMSIAGLHKIDDGEIYVGDVAYTVPKKGLFLPPEKRDIGMVFQSYAIWPHMTVAQNVAYPLEIRKVDPPRQRCPQTARDPSDQRRKSLASRLNIGRTRRINTRRYSRRLKHIWLRYQESGQSSHASQTGHQ